MFEHLGRILIFTGIILVIAGIILLFAGNKLGWLGHLPGDIRIVRENFRFYFPITTVIILSIVISVVIYLIRKFFQG
jgi:uncharacterized protein HemY